MQTTMKTTRPARSLLDQVLGGTPKTAIHARTQAWFPALWLICAAAAGVTPAFAQTSRYWTGHDSANWSDPKNWSSSATSGGTNGAPQNGDTLYFGFNASGDSNDNMTNDIVHQRWWQRKYLCIR